MNADELACDNLRQVPVGEVARPWMESLLDLSDETVMFVVLCGTKTFVSLPLDRHRLDQRGPGSKDRRVTRAATASGYIRQERSLSVPDFIEAYDDVLDAETCAALIRQFDASSAKAPGVTGHGLEPGKKDSTDINLTARPEWKPLHDRLIEATFPYLTQYVRKYPFLVAGAIALQLRDHQTGENFHLTYEQMDRVPDQQLNGILMLLYRSGVVNMQKYERGTGGYHHWHSEIFPKDPHCETLHRVLLYMYYLNDVAEGGETECYFQDRKLAPRRGRLVIAPAGFTHTHKGHVPRSEDKYIVTSWVMFNRAETIYRVNP
jgi:hypothetical protein